MKKFWSYLYSAFIYFLLYFPIAIVVLLSFNNTNRALAWNGFTLKWYSALFQNAALLSVTWHSLILAISSASLSALLGTIIAVALFRYKFWGRDLVHGSVFVLVLLPEIVIAVAMLLFYNFFQIPLGFTSLLLGHVALCVPFATVSVQSRIGDLNKQIFEAAQDLGASDYIIYTKILIPLLWPAILAGWLLSFTLSLDNIIISYFVGGPSFDLLPLKIFAMVKLGVKPEINALCTIMLMVTLAAVILSYGYIFKQEQHEES